MINPQMGLPNVPTVKELWKDEKSKYRHWILLFGIGIAVIFILQLISFIMNMVSADTIKETLEGYIDTKGKSKVDIEEATKQGFIWNFVVTPLIQMLLVGLGLLYFLTTIYSSYKNHSFSKISQWATMVIGIGAFIAIYQLFQMAWSTSSRIVLDDAFPGGIFQFVNYFLMICVYFGASIKVGKIRREFAISERVEQLKNDPVFQQQMQMFQDNMMKNGGMQMGPMGPMGQMSAMTPQQDIKSTNQVTEQVINQKTGSDKSKEETELEIMKLPQLKEVAKKLSISGYKTMKKKEIIKAILRVTQK